MIKTDKGEYLSEFTSEMMEKVKQYDKYPDPIDICKRVTGKFIYEHEQDFVDATWDLPFKFDAIEELGRWCDWKMKDEIEDELRQVGVDAINKHLQERFNVKNDEKVEMEFQIPVTIDKGTIAKYRTQQMHIKYPETSPWTYEQVMNLGNEISKKSGILRNFIHEKVLPIVNENYQRKQEQDRLKRNLKAKERRQAKKQNQG